jgi:hypothetical protein
MFDHNRSQDRWRCRFPLRAYAANRTAISCWLLNNFRKYHPETAAIPRYVILAKDCRIYWYSSEVSEAFPHAHHGSPGLFGGSQPVGLTQIGAVGCTSATLFTDEFSVFNQLLVIIKITEKVAHVFQVA